MTVQRGSRRELPFAAIPLFFAVQQLIEGALWLTLPAQTASVHILTLVYLVFANMLWPVYIPVAILLIEPTKLRRKRLLLPLVAGALTTLFFIRAIATQSVSSAINGSHIHYHFPHTHDKIAFAFYVVATCLAPLLSSYRVVQLIGVILVVSMVAAYIFYAVWFASVWCYFAAIISAVVCLHFRRQAARESSELNEQPA